MRASEPAIITGDIFDMLKLCPDARLVVALISDTHGYLDERIAGIIQHCDAVIHAGDIGSKSVIDALRPRHDIIVAVRGNNDIPSKWPPADRRYLALLEDSSSLSLPGGQLHVVHGDKFNPVKCRHLKLRKSFPNARAVVYGHSHRLIIDDHAHPWILNPGAAGHARTYGGPSCLILTIKETHWSLQAQRFDPMNANKKRYKVLN